MKFKDFYTQLIVEGTSPLDVTQQLVAIRDGKGPYETQLRKWILGEESQFDTSGPRNFQTHAPKQIPAEIKKLYPDICFALQRLALHLGANRSFNDWNKLKDYLSFVPPVQEHTFYRLWGITEEQLAQLQKSQSINVAPEYKPYEKAYLSYTYNPSLFRYDNKYKDSLGNKMQLGAFSTELVLQTNAQALMIMTQHRFVPIFNLFRFSVHVYNRAKKVFGTEPKGFGTLEKFAHEREVIGPAISIIRPEDVSKVYRNGLESALADQEHKIQFSPDRSYIVTQGLINSWKETLTKYGGIDGGPNNAYIATTHPETSAFSRYLEKGWHENPELSKLLGAKIWTGYWR